MPLQCIILHCFMFKVYTKPLLLEGGSFASEGRVKLFHNGEWGTICDDLFDLKDAHVVCRQAGYKYALRAGTASTMGFGQGTGPIHMDSVQCTGRENKVQNCPFGGWGTHDCSHVEDAGVVCDTSWADKCRFQSTRVEKEKSK